MPSEDDSGSPSELIDARIEELPDWKEEVLPRIHRLIAKADPEVVEEERTGELRRAAPRIAPVKSRRDMLHEVEASVEGEALVFGEVQHHWRPVDAHPNVLDAVCVRLASLTRILYYRS